MRVVTWNVKNLHFGVEAVALLLAEIDADVICLQEVPATRMRALASAVGRRSYHARTLWWGFGNAVLARERFAATRRVLFSPTKGQERRGCAVADLSWGRVASVHLGLTSEERARHATELLDAVGDERPVVIAGDLNEEVGGAVLASVSDRFEDAYAVAGEGDGSTFPADAPRIRIDFVLVSRGTPVKRCVVGPTAASDHRPVVAELGIA